jgi:hypothetical protein
MRITRTHSGTVWSADERRRVESERTGSASESPVRGRVTTDRSHPPSMDMRLRLDAGEPCRSARAARIGLSAARRAIQARGGPGWLGPRAPSPLRSRRLHGLIATHTSHRAARVRAWVTSPRLTTSAAASSGAAVHCRTKRSERSRSIGVLRWPFRPVVFLCRVDGVSISCAIHPKRMQQRRLKCRGRSFALGNIVRVFGGACRPCFHSGRRVFDVIPIPWRTFVAVPIATFELLVKPWILCSQRG